MRREIDEHLLAVGEEERGRGWLWRVSGGLIAVVVVLVLAAALLWDRLGVWG